MRRWVDITNHWNAIKKRLSYSEVRTVRTLHYLKKNASSEKPFKVYKKGREKLSLAKTA